MNQRDPLPLTLGVPNHNMTVGLPPVGPFELGVDDCFHDIFERGKRRNPKLSQLRAL